MKKIIAFALIVILPIPMLATSYTASLTGNWANILTWGGAGVPGCGDTVILGNGVTVTVPAGTVACAGTSDSNNTGTAAIADASTTGTGILQVYGQLVVKGRIDEANANWLVSTANWTTAGDGTVVFDATGATTPTNAQYTWNLGLTASTNGFLTLTGSATHHVDISSASNVPMGGFGNPAPTADSGRIVGGYWDAHYIGQATATGVFDTIRLTSSAGIFSVNNCTLDHSGSIRGSSAIGAAATFSMTNCTITNPVATANSITELEATTAMTTGTRLFRHNMFVDGKVYIDGTPNQSNGFTMEDNLFEASAANTAISTLNATNGSPFVSFANNGFIGNHAFDNVGAGTLSNSYIMEVCNPGSCSNTHPFNFKVKAQNVLFDGWVVDGTQQSDDGDIFEATEDSTVVATATLKNTYFLASLIGKSVGSHFNGSWLTTSWANLKFVEEHNYAVISGQNVGNPSIVQGSGCEGAPKTMPANTITVACNSYTRPTSGTGIAIQSQTSTCGVTAGAVALADWNNVDPNITSSIYGNPSAQFSTTPGPHDTTFAAGYVRPGPNFGSYDTASPAIGGLGHALGTGWSAASVSYTAGDIVSHTITGYYGTATYNYTAKDNHVSSSTTEPGVGSAWASHWVFTTQRDIEAGTLSGAGPNTASLMTYVKLNYLFTNVSLHNACGLDGLDIGPVGTYTPAQQTKSFTETF
jgi:hypothetical protein